MDLMTRVQGIIVRPGEEWGIIKEESTPISFLFTTYAALLALIPAFTQFISYGFIGFRGSSPGWISYGVGMAFFRSILLYVLSLVSVYVLGIIINFLAPNFSSTQNIREAMKLAVYSMTPVWLGGIFFLVYPLRGLAYIASLYGIYILYLGIAHPILATPKEKVFSYLAINVVVAFVLMAVVANMLKLIFAGWVILRSF